MYVVLQTFRSYFSLIRFLCFISTFDTFESTTESGGSLIITGVIDGPISGGEPKAIELYALDDIDDLTEYSVGSANEAISVIEYTFINGSLNKGDFIYVANNKEAFTSFFGIGSPEYVVKKSSAASVNGNDAVEVFYRSGENINSTKVIDAFGFVDDSGIGGINLDWDYTDGWAYRNSSSSPTGATPSISFNINDWYFSGRNALENVVTTNDGQTYPFPIGTFEVLEPDDISTTSANIDTTESDSESTTEMSDSDASESTTNIPGDGTDAYSTTSTTDGAGDSSGSDGSEVPGAEGAGGEGSSSGGSNSDPISQNLLIVIIICGTVVILAVILMIGLVCLRKKAVPKGSVDVMDASPGSLVMMRKSSKSRSQSNIEIAPTTPVAGATGIIDTTTAGLGSRTTTTGGDVTPITAPGTPMVEMDVVNGKMEDIALGVPAIAAVAAVAPMEPVQQIGNKTDDFVLTAEAEQEDTDGTDEEMYQGVTEGRVTRGTAEGETNEEYGDNGEMNVHSDNLDPNIDNDDGMESTEVTGSERSRKDVERLEKVKSESNLDVLEKEEKKEEEVASAKPAFSSNYSQYSHASDMDVVRDLDNTQGA